MTQKGRQFEWLDMNHFDWDKYLGHWYQIARIDFYWERDVYNSQAHYTKQGNSVNIKNTCIDYDNKYDEALGLAAIKSSRQLGVGFGPFKKFMQFGHYHVATVEKNYQIAVVYGGTGYLWVLSRTPHLKDGEYNQIEEFLKNGKYQYWKLKRIYQNGKQNVK